MTINMNFTVKNKIMKIKNLFYSQPSYLIRTAIEAEILFAVCVIEKQALTGGKSLACEDKCSKKIGAKSAVLHFVFFMIIINKMQQSAKRKLLLNKNSLSEVFPLTVGSGKTMTFENRRGKYKELGKKVPQAYRVYVEDSFLPCDAGDARIFSKEETGLYYYGARYLDPKYSRWLSGDPALGEYIPKQGEDIGKLPNNGVYNVINLHIFSYANNNPIKYNDPTGEIPTPYEAAIMAEHIYNGKIGDIVEGGWTLNNIYQLNQDGGSGAIGVYSRLVIDEKGYPVDVEYALVNRGTSPTNLEDWSQNIDQFFGDSSDVAMSISIAIDFVQNHIYSEVTMVGHSKGGAEAILNALKTGKNAIVFNPAKPTLNGLSKSENFLQAFVVTGDILHGIQGHLPDIIDTTYLPRQYRGKERYSHSHGYDIRHEIFPHSMEAVIQALKE